MPANTVEATRVPIDTILDMRAEYRRAMDCQIVHDSWHARGFTVSYLLTANGEVAGYGSVGGPPREPRDIIKEFYVVPAQRGHALPLFRRLADVSRARWVEAQTNDALLLLMLHDCAIETSSEIILFADGVTTSLGVPARGAAARRLSDAERAHAFVHTLEPVGEWGIERDGEVIATGGLAFHYNPPYGDIYMEVAALHQRLGFGSYLVQELKRVCYEMGRIPGARCNAANVASRRTLERAGMFPCARIVRGRLDA